jgi:hypothetical protein
VADDADRSCLVGYFQKHASITGNLEAFKMYKKGDNRKNKRSSNGFGAVKFIIRPPARVDSFTKFNLGQKIYEKVPVEVQILTLQDDHERKNNPDATHEQYKKRQFLQLFPVIFPRQIYEPLM